MTSITQGQCPSCGGPINFAIGSSLVVVCPHCRSVVARTDRALESLGKVAALVETNSPLSVGLSGKFQGHSFRLVGRAQLRHAAGGIWNEWYAAFDDRRWGWLAEAQGRFYLTFAVPAKSLPQYEQLALGQPAPGLPPAMQVAELATAKYLTAEGEIPFRLTPDAEYDYADLSGPEHAFGTLDYSDDQPQWYLGWELPLSDLHLDASTAAPAIKQVAVTRLGCPKCGGSLELRAPDQTQRVGCPYCGALLECNRGDLRYLSTLADKDRWKPLIPLGAQAEFEGVTLTVIGFFVRSCKIEGSEYFWREYLLYEPKLGFRWLVHSDGHWTYVKPMPAGAARPFKRDLVYENETFQRYQDASAVMRYVAGECYWPVQVGETVKATDWIAPPRMISCETAVLGLASQSDLANSRDAHASDADAQEADASEAETQEADASEGNAPAAGANDGSPQQGEINWSLGEYVTLEEIRQKFKVADLPVPTTVGPCEPFPNGGVYRIWRWALLGAVVLILLFHAIAPHHTVFERDIAFPDRGTAEAPPVVFSDSFEIEGHKNLHIRAQSHIYNTWVYLTGDLINDETGLVQSFELPIEYYSGSDSDGPWTEGSQDADVYLAALPAGKYTLRIEAEWDPGMTSAGANVRIVQGEPHWTNDWFLLLALTAVPVITFIREILFTGRRWSESMYGSS